MNNTNNPSNTQLAMFPTNSQIDFWQRINAGEGLACPCCNRYAQLYTRKIHTSIALQLIKLYKLGGQTDFIHTSKLIAPGCSGIGDFSKAKYWDLIEPMDASSEHEKKHSGYWRLTDKGEAFVLGKISIMESALVFDDKVLSFSGEQRNISEALGDKFNYADMMNA